MKDSLFELCYRKFLTFHDILIILDAPVLTSNPTQPQFIKIIIFQQWTCAVDSAVVIHHTLHDEPLLVNNRTSKMAACFSDFVFCSMEVVAAAAWPNLQDGTIAAKQPWLLFVRDSEGDYKLRWHSGNEWFQSLPSARISNHAPYSIRCSTFFWIPPSECTLYVNACHYSFLVCVHQNMNVPLRLGCRQTGFWLRKKGALSDTSLGIVSKTAWKRECVCACARVCVCEEIMRVLLSEREWECVRLWGRDCVCM